MEWRTLAFKNARGQARRFVGYLLSASLAVTVFFLFALFVNNPVVEAGYMTDFARRLLTLSRVVVVLFSIFFIGYFHSSLVRLRGKEFGMLLVLGMTPKQVGRMIFLESLLLGGIALLIGSLLGLVFGKLFLLAMGNILQLQAPITFLVPEGVVSSTVLVFGIVFVIEGALSAWRVSRRTPLLLLRSKRRRQAPPRTSWWRILLAVAMIGGGYGLAVTSGKEVASQMLPILLLTCAGTYYFFTQLLVMVLNALRKRALHGSGLLVASRLLHRVRDQARMLTVVTILIAMVLTGMGAVFGMKQVLALNSMRVNPVGVQMIVQEDRATVDPQEGMHLRVPLLFGKISGEGKRGSSTWVIADSGYQALKKAVLQARPELTRYFQEELPLKTGEGRFHVPYPLMLGEQFPNHQARLQIGTQNLPLRLQDQADTRVLNSQNGTDFMLILTDEDFARLEQTAFTENRWVSDQYMLDDWTASASAAANLRERAAEDIANGQAYVTDTGTVYLDSEKMVGVMLFTGLFLSLLFFLAAAVSIYFKLFAQQEEDARQFQALRRMGFTRKEAGRILTVELALLFFLPFLVALLHSVAAMVSFSNLLTMQGSVWGAYLAVGGLSFLCFFAAFAAARVRYLRQVWHK